MTWRNEDYGLSRRHSALGIRPGGVAVEWRQPVSCDRTAGVARRVHRHHPCPATPHGSRRPLGSPLPERSCSRSLVVDRKAGFRSGGKSRESSKRTSAYPIRRSSACPLVTGLDTRRQPASTSASAEAQGDGRPGDVIVDRRDPADKGRDTPSASPPYPSSLCPTRS